MENNKEKKEYNSLIIDDAVYETKLTKKFVSKKPFKLKNPKLVTAFIPGTIIDVFVKAGQNIIIGQDLLVLEAMKMKNTIKSASDGKVKQVYVSVGQKVAKLELLLELD